MKLEEDLPAWAAFFGSELGLGIMKLMSIFLPCRVGSWVLRKPWNQGFFSLEAHLPI
jgi:hypothetical protein